jgi:hypothetical protein
MDSLCKFRDSLLETFRKFNEKDEYCELEVIIVCRSVVAVRSTYQTRLKIIVSLNKEEKDF